MNMLRPLVQYIREKLGYRVLPYIDNFLVAPCPEWRSSTEEYCRKAREKLQSLFDRLGLHRHPEKVN